MVGGGGEEGRLTISLTELGRGVKPSFLFKFRLRLNVPRKIHFKLHSVIWNVFTFGNPFSI